MYPSKITVSKSLTKEKNKQWDRAEFSIEMTLSDGDDIQVAKDWASSLLDTWITEFEKAS